MSETTGINKPYSTERENEELLLVTFVELKKDWHTLCLLVASATAVNKSDCCTVVVFDLELKTNIASSVELLGYNGYLCHWIYSRIHLKKARTFLQRICQFVLIK